MSMINDFKNNQIILPTNQIGKYALDLNQDGKIQKKKELIPDLNGNNRTDDSEILAFAVNHIKDPILVTKLTRISLKNENFTDEIGNYFSKLFELKNSLIKNEKITLPTGDKVKVENLHYDDNKKILTVWIDEKSIRTEIKLPTGEKIIIKGGATLEFNENDKLILIDMLNPSEVTLPTGEKFKANIIEFNNDENMTYVQINRKPYIRPVQISKVAILSSKMLSEQKTIVFENIVIEKEKGIDKKKNKEKEIKFHYTPTKKNPDYTNLLTKMKSETWADLWREDTFINKNFSHKQLSDIQVKEKKSPEIKNKKNDVQIPKNNNRISKIKPSDKDSHFNKMKSESKTGFEPYFGVFSNAQPEMDLRITSISPRSIIFGDYADYPNQYITIPTGDKIPAKNIHFNNAGNIIATQFKEGYEITLPTNDKVNANYLEFNDKQITYGESEKLEKITLPTKDVVLANQFTFNKNNKLIYIKRAYPKLSMFWYDEKTIFVQGGLECDKITLQNGKKVKFDRYVELNDKGKVVDYDRCDLNKFPNKLPNYLK